MEEQGTACGNRGIDNQTSNKTQESYMLRAFGKLLNIFVLAGYLRPVTGFALDVKAGKKAESNSFFLSISSANSDIGQEGYTGRKDRK